MTDLPNYTMKAEWRGRASFAEYAEALSIPTLQVLMALQHRGVTYVYWSTRAQMDTGNLEATLVNTSLLRRDVDGVLQIVETFYDAGTVGDLIP